MANTQLFHVCAKPLQSCPTLCDPVDCSLSGSSVHGLLQARILERVAMTSFRGSSRSRDQIRVSYISCIGRQVLYHQHHLGSPVSSYCLKIPWFLVVVVVQPYWWFLGTLSFVNLRSTALDSKCQIDGQDSLNSVPRSRFLYSLIQHSSFLCRGLSVFNQGSQPIAQKMGSAAGHSCALLLQGPLLPTSSFPLLFNHVLKDNSSNLMNAPDAPGPTQGHYIY